MAPVEVREREEVRAVAPERPSRLRRWLRGLGIALGAALVTLAALAVAVVAIVYTGSVEVAAGQPYADAVAWFFNTSARRRIAQAAGDVEAPLDLTDPLLQEEGLLQYRALCEQCHGGPGVPPGPTGRGLSPAPTRLWEGAGPRTEGRPARIAWVIEHGIRRSGMPAYDEVLSERARWALVGFLLELPTLDPELYQVWTEQAEARAAARADGDEQAPAATPPATGIYEQVYCDDLYGPWGPPTGLGPPR